jgi:hypothetical protein
MIDRDFIYAIHDRAADQVAASDGRLDRVTDIERAVFVLLYSHGTILNGGVAAMFYNPVGEYWMEAIAAADAYGLAEYAAILREAASVFPDGQVPREHCTREQRLYEDDITDEWLTQLDERWFAVQPELEDQLVEYARSRPETFTPPA